MRVGSNRSAGLGGARGAGTASPRLTPPPADRERSSRNLTAGPKGLTAAIIVGRVVPLAFCRVGSSRAGAMRPAEAVKLRVRSVDHGLCR
jgi:hypothetical protein